MTELLIGRQPIFSPQLKLAGYELLYRAVGSDHADFIDGDAATTQVIINTFSGIGLDQLVGNTTAYINATRNFLTGKYPIPFPPNQVVLEILEDIILDQEMVYSLRQLARAGYKFALDDVTSPSEITPVIDLLSVIKVDTLHADPTKVCEIVSRYKSLQVKLLAEKIETLKDFEHLKKLGFDYFQGYFLSKPNIVKRKEIDTSRLVILNTLSKLQDPETNFSSMECIISQDVSLSYKLLKLVNSAHYSIPSEIKSISQAISFIGMNQLKGWLTLFLISSVDNKPHELTKIAMIRAKMCELSARFLGFKDPAQYFMIGLLSVLDAIMDIPMVNITKQLPVPDDIKIALLYHKGKAGKILSSVLAYENGEWKKALNLISSAEVLRKLYVESIEWASLFELSI